MKTWIMAGLIGLALAGSAAAQDELNDPEPQESIMVLIKTSKGDIKVELNEKKAPVTVKNFLAYVDAGHYDGTIFHRVIGNFMIQGGGFTKDMRQKPTRAPIANEAANGLGNERGTIAMARTSDINSATSQFFINVVNNAFLNHRDKSAQGFGYCVFGKVTEGMDVVDAIKAVPTGAQDIPRETVEIISITRAE